MGKRFRQMVIGAAIFLSVASSGCFQYCPVKSQFATRRAWKTGIMVKKAKKGFRYNEVLISRNVGVLPRVCTNTLETGFNSTKKKEKALIKGGLEYLSYMNIQNPEVVAMLENNIYLSNNSESKSDQDAAGGFNLGRIRGLTISDVHGRTIRDCPGGCENVNFIMMNKDTTKEFDRSVTFVHELLHDAWYTVLSEETKKSFLGLMRKLLDIGSVDGESGSVFQTFGLNEYGRTALILDFLKSHEPTFDSAEKMENLAILGWYFTFRLVADSASRIYMESGLSREKFIETEAYPVFFNVGTGVLDRYYSAIISERGMKELRVNTEGLPHLSEKKVKGKMSILEAFTKYLGRLHSSYLKKLTKIKTEDDLKRYIKTKP